jgi:hypothetical protein
MQRKSIVLFSIAAAIFLMGAWYYLSNRPPQMGPDDEVFRTVDALYTAVTARQEKLLAQCEARLQAQKTEGKLPPSAAIYLDNIIATARAGHWQPAAEKLHTFMATQRRSAK